MSSARPCFPVGSNAAPACTLPKMASVGLSVVLWRSSWTPGDIFCSSTSFGRSVSRPMIVPGPECSANRPILLGQIPLRDLGNHLPRHLRQLLDQFSHGFE